MINKRKSASGSLLADNICSNVLSRICSCKLCELLSEPSYVI